MDLITFSMLMVALCVIGWAWTLTDDLHAFLVSGGELEYINAIDFHHRITRHEFYIYYRVRVYTTHDREATPVELYVKAPDVFVICNESLKRRLFQRTARLGGVRHVRILDYELIR